MNQHLRNQHQRRRHAEAASKPAQKFRPEPGDRIFIRDFSVGEWIGGNVGSVGYTFGTMEVARDDGKTEIIDAGAYPTAWVWPHDMVNVGMRDEFSDRSDLGIVPPVHQEDGLELLP